MVRADSVVQPLMIDLAREEHEEGAGGGMRLECEEHTGFSTSTTARENG